MNTNKNISEDKLRELFKEIPLNEPSPDFMTNLLLRVEKETLRKNKVRERWTIVGQIAAGIFGILILPALTIYLCTIFFPDFSFSFPKIQLHFDSNLLVISFSILLLLILDALLRMYAANRRKTGSQ